MKRTLQQAALILFGEEVAKKATNRVEAVKGIQKTYQKPGEKFPWHFFGYNPGINQTAMGML